MIRHLYKSGTWDFWNDIITYDECVMLEFINHGRMYNLYYVLDIQLYKYFKRSKINIHNDKVIPS